MESRYTSTDLIYRQFEIRKISWSLYVLEHPKAKGLVRIISMPSGIYEVPSKQLESQAASPELIIYTTPIGGFTSLSKTGLRKSGPAGMDEPQGVQKEDLTSYAVPKEEPWCEYIVRSSSNQLLRIRSILAKVELLKGRRNALGEPELLLSQAAAFSYSRLESNHKQPGQIAHQDNSTRSSVA